MVSLNEIIPDIKPDSDIKIGKNECDGCKLDDEYSSDLFYRNSFFEGYFLKKENSEKLRMVLDILESCGSKDQWDSALRTRELDKKWDECEAMRSADSGDIVGFGLSQFNNQIVIDLGCGYHANGYEFASLVGAKGYIGVDMFHGNRLMENKRAFSSDETKKSILESAQKMGAGDAMAIPVSFSANDILTFLRRLPDNSVSILASGIDKNVLNNNGEYIEKINKEIQRVLNDKGIFMSYESCFHPKELRSENEIMGSHYGIDLYKKPKQKNTQE